MAHQCLRCRCLPGWHGGQRLWGLLLRHGWVLRTGRHPGVQRHLAIPFPPHAPWACSRAVRGAAAGGLTRGWLLHACEPPQRTPASSPSSV